ncbi:hypothetical protein [Streptacidiphilus rugosus]|nr:hypothetical protein [Streptacidiphilus rugosus]
MLPIVEPERAAASERGPEPERRPESDPEIHPAAASEGAAETTAEGSAEKTAVMPVVVPEPEPASEATDAAGAQAEAEAAADTGGSPLARVRAARAARAQAKAKTEEAEATAPTASPAPASSAEETMVLPPFPAQPPVVGTPAAEPESPKARRPRLSRKASAEPTASSMDETTVMPIVPPVDQTPLPRSWREASPRSAESVQDRVPDWLFRPQPGRAGSEAPTSEIPILPAAVSPEAAEPSAEQPKDAETPAGETPASGGRYDWAEETPLDDLPTLTDQLLGTREEWAQWHAEHPDQPEGPDDQRGRGPGPGRHR